MITNYKLQITNKNFGPASPSQGGYALLFTLIIISIMMTFAVGMSNNALKQMILSSTATDSQIAFYQADTAGECALYIATHPTIDVTLPVIINCGADLIGNSIGLITQLPPAGFNYSLKSISPLQEPCFNIEIDKNARKIKAYGYNICNPTSSNRVERGIEITF